MNSCNFEYQSDYGANPYIANVKQMAVQNDSFRTAIWTGCHFQMTLMSIPMCEEIGLEMHGDTDQLIRIECGSAVVCMGKCKHNLDFRQKVCEGDAIWIPAGTWHNIINTGRTALKVSSVYAPSKHPWGTVHCTKEDAQSAAY